MCQQKTPPRDGMNDAKPLNANITWPATGSISLASTVSDG